MGRQQYLSRLALGRSAFAEVGDGEPATDNQQQTHADIDETSPDQQYVQQYDSKGRPINPSTEERNTALRKAKNSALELVGVVERKDSQDRVTELKYRTIRTVREALLAEEQDAGENLDLFFTILSFTNYASETLVRRVQAGLYRPSDSFASIISGGLSAMRHAGLKGSLAILFPGAPAALAYSTIRVLIGATLSTGVEYLSQWLIRQRLRKRTARRLLRGLYFACEALLIGLDIALLPLEYYAYTQRLGLAPLSPILPNWRIVFPSHPASIHTIGWGSPLTTLPIFHTICSPAILLLLQNTIWREQDAEVPIASQITPFEYPQPFNARPWTLSPPKPTRDPLGYLLYQGYVLRVRFLRACGYHLELRGRGTKFENDRLPRVPPPQTLDEIPKDSSSDESDWDGDDDEERNGRARRGDGMHHAHRSTDLAHLAPKYLSNRIDVAFAKLLLLPLQALVVRSITHSYLFLPSSVSPKTPLALAALPHLMTQFGAGHGPWGDRGSQLSKLGLSLALHTAGSTGLLFMMWRLVRWQGIRNFDWGVKGSVGGLAYPTGDEE